MSKELYFSIISPASRIVLLTLKAIGEPGEEFERKEMDIVSQEQMSPDFVAMNPQHCVPTLVDDDQILWESRAISSYLATKYGGDDSLYPNDVDERVKVDRLLYFDIGTLFSRFQQYVDPVAHQGESPNPEKLERLQEALGWLDSFLDGQDFTAGDHITVADFSLASTVSTIEESGIDISSFENVTAWLQRCKEQMIGYDEANGEGARRFGSFVKAKFGIEE